MDKIKPILVVRIPLHYDMMAVEATKRALASMTALGDDYHVIVATTDKQFPEFEVSCHDNVTGVHLKQFKQFKTIIENESKFRANGESSESK